MACLYVTDVACRRFILRLPTLEWTTSRELPGSDCGLWTRQPSDADSGLAARQVNADTIEVSSGGWSFGFEGISPAFKPDGILTFVRDGRLREWTGRCPETARKVVFEGLHDVTRCDRPVAGAPRDVREVAWLSVRDYAVVAGPDGATSLEVVRGGRTERLFNSVGARMGALEASPSGRYVVVRLDGALTLFRTDAVSSASSAARQRRARPLDHVVARRAPGSARDGQRRGRLPERRGRPGGADPALGQDRSVALRTLESEHVFVRRPGLHWG